MFRAKTIFAVGPLLLPAVLGACTTSSGSSPAVLAQADLVSASGQPAGSAVIAKTSDGAALTLNVSGLAPGLHGAHLHTTGACDGPAFTSAGAHLNPHGKLHGSENPQGSHMGDLPNITAGPDGRAGFTAPLSGSTTELEAFLFDADGTAIVIHASPDDYRTDPSGNSGGRIACGVLQRG
jgi:Cu-Zn family superoxide dismutase